VRGKLLEIYKYIAHTGRGTKWSTSNRIL